MANEIEAFDDYKGRYHVLHPPPRKPNPARLDWKFYLTLIIVPAQILLVGLRTANIFYKAAELGGSPLLAQAEAVLAIMAVEVGLVVYSATKAARKTTVSDFTINIGIWLMVLISVFAGLSQSIHLIDGVNPTLLLYLQYGVSIVIGVGASIIAWIGGEILGSQVALMGIKTNALNAEYDIEMQEYNKRLIASWNSSPERKLVRADTVEAARQIDSSFVRSERTNTGRGTNLPNYGANEVRQRIISYLEDNATDEEIPGPTEVSEALDVSKGYAHRVIHEWAENGNAD